MKTKKVMEIDCNGVWLVAIYDTSEKFNKFKLYQKYYDGRTHKRLLHKYANMQSVLCAVSRIDLFGIENLEVV